MNDFVPLLRQCCKVCQCLENMLKMTLSFLHNIIFSIQYIFVLAEVNQLSHHQLG